MKRKEPRTVRVERERCSEVAGIMRAITAVHRLYKRLKP